MTTVDLAYDVSGGGWPLVAIHGITDDRHSWDPVPFGDRYRVMRVDLRGHGQSPSIPPYDVQSLARDVQAVVRRETDGQAPIVVGHSMGGVVATAYASLFPVRAVVNVDQPLALVAMQVQVQAASAMLRGDGIEAFIDGMFAAMNGALDPAEADRLATRRVVNQDAVLGMWSPLLDLTPEELEAHVKRIATLPEVAYLSLHGLDPGEDYASWLRTLIPHAVVEVWKESPTHFPHLADPARFVRRIEEFAS